MTTSRGLPLCIGRRCSASFANMGSPFVEPMGWQRAFAALVEFKKVHGHCNVPQKSGEHKRLGKWVNTQRTQHYRGKLRADRKQLLDSIGFVWNLRPNLAAAR